MLSNFYEEAGMLLDYVQDATLYNCKLSYCFLEDSYINNSPIGLINPNEARFTNVTLNNLLVTSGNIGIDVANPSYKLDVNGDINFTGFLYKNGILYTGGGGGGAGGNGSTNVFITRSAQSIGTQTITNGLNVLKFPDNEITSNHIAYNSTTGAFSVSVEGLYSIFVDVDFYNADKAIDLYILKNGVEDSSEGRIAWVNCPANDAATINANVYLQVGDYITVNIYNSSVNSFTTPYANNKVNSFAMALFNSSQWEGDKGNPISYTAASVTMTDTIITNLTVNNVLVTVGSVGIGTVADPAYKLDVTGDINFTGDLYKNDVLYLPRPVYITRSAQTKDAQTISTGVNVLKFPDAGQSTGDISYSSVTGRFTVNQDGLYSVFVDLDFYNADKAIDLYILKNGVEDSTNGRIAWINCPANDATSINAMVYLEETDYITVIVKNNSANSFTTPYDNNKVNSFAMSLMNSSSTPRSSQWIGDIGSTISYTSGNVVMTDVTVSNVLITNATVTGTILILGNSLKAISDSNTIGSIITTGGNVGIGTTAPSSRLEVIGDLRITSGNLLLSSISAGSGIATIGTVVSTNTSTQNLTFTTVSAGSATATIGSIFLTNNLNASFNSNTLGSIFTTGGNIGIGSTSPSSILEISSSNPGLTLYTTSGNCEINFIRGSKTFGGDGLNDYKISNSGGSFLIVNGLNTTISNLMVMNANNTVFNRPLRIVSTVGNTLGSAFHVNHAVPFPLDGSSITANNVYGIRLNAGTAGSSSWIFSQNENDGLSIIYTNSSGSYSADRFTMLTNGNLGLGTTSPSFRLQLSTDSAAKPSTNTWTISSDVRLKTDIIDADLDICYNNVKTIPLKRYRWRDDVYTEEQVYDRMKIGWIAQDVELVFPKAVEQHEMFGYTDCRTLNSDQIYASMYGAIQKLIYDKERLETELDIVKTFLKSKYSDEF